MKKQKILLCLVFALALVLVLASCQGGIPHDGGCFEFTEDEVYNTVDTLEGDVLNYSKEYNLIAMETVINAYDGHIQRHITVYDLLTGKDVLSQSDAFSDWDGYVNKTVDFSSYPLVKIKYESRVYEDGSYLTRYFTDVYMLECYENGGVGYRQLAYGLEVDNATSARIGNMYVCRAGDRVIWQGLDLRVVREIPTNVHDSYITGNIENYFNVFAENDYYLYAWEFSDENRMAVVYGPDGVATAKFDFSTGAVVAKDESGSMLDSIINPSVYVLNDGNLLVQECIIAEGDDYDFVYANQKLKLRTSVMNRESGAVQEVECGFIIVDLESSYEGELAEKSAFPLNLADSYDNQAYVIDIVNGALDIRQRYVVLDNNAKVVYELKNDYLALECDYTSITDADEDGYVATATVFGVKAQHRFNYKGEVVYTRPTGYLGETDNLYYTRSGIYKKNGKLVFDNEEYAKGGNPVYEILSYGNRILLGTVNYETGKTEIYFFDEESSELVIMTDGKYTDVKQFEESFYSIYDSDKKVTSFYNSNGELLVKVAGEQQLTECKDVAFVEVEISGESFVYVIKYVEESN